MPALTESSSFGSRRPLAADQPGGAAWIAAAPGASSTEPATGTGQGRRPGAGKPNASILSPAQEHHGANSDARPTFAQSDRRLDLAADARREPDPWSES